MKKSIWLMLSVVYGASAFADVAVKIPCKDASGVIQNADPSQVCKNIVPKCTDVKAAMVKGTRSMLAWKILGLYNGKDLDLNQTFEGSISSLKGTAFSDAVCSVVGDKIKTTTGGVISNAEVTTSIAGGGRSCGTYPKTSNSKKNMTIDMKYTAENGTIFTSYVNGAMIWEIRANAFDVMNGLNANLSNLQDILKSSEGTLHVTEINAALQAMKTEFDKLSGNEKMACSSTTQTNLIEGCMNGTISVTDPVHRICDLVKAQSAMNGIVVANGLASEVMARAKKAHTAHFALIFTDANDDFSRYVNYCMKDWGNSRRGRLSCATSCLLDGEEWYTGDTQHSGNQSWKNSGGKASRKCTIRVRFNVQTGGLVNAYVLSSTDEGTDADGNETQGQITAVSTNTIDTVTSNHNFAGLIEYIIRKKVCGQTKKSDESTRCKIDGPYYVPNNPTSIQ